MVTIFVCMNVLTSESYVERWTSIEIESIYVYNNTTTIKHIYFFMQLLILVKEVRYFHLL